MWVCVCVVDTIWQQSKVNWSTQDSQLHCHQQIEKTPCQDIHEIMGCTCTDSHNWLAACTERQDKAVDTLCFVHNCPMSSQKSATQSKHSTHTSQCLSTCRLRCKEEEPAFRLFHSKNSKRTHQLLRNKFLKCFSWGHLMVITTWKKFFWGERGLGVWMGNCYTQYKRLRNSFRWEFLAAQ